MSEPRLTFKVASVPVEFEQIHQLNYQTFVEEIPQHEGNLDRRLVDKLDAENTYLIALKGDRLVGMVAVRANRPLSLDAKLDNLDSYLPAGRSICELRLLSVVAGERGRLVLPGLMRMLAEHCETKGYDMAVISGTTRQEKLYRHLGFVPFGPVVGSSEAPFQPMYLTREAVLERSAALLERTGQRPDREPVNLLPGPVSIHDDVRRAFSAVPISHRSELVVDTMRQVQALLRDMTGARSVSVLMGSGTLANDAIAAQLSLVGGNGIVLSNGEFGDRLIDHATRAGLAFDVIRAEWGTAFDAAVIEATGDGKDIQWIWAVHSETSTGVLNDLAMLQCVADRRNARLCLDCVSSIGVLPVNLTGIFLASGVSGKGLGAFPGLSIIFADHSVEPMPDRLPRYLDLGLYQASDGIPFTLSSNLISALLVALKRMTFIPSFSRLKDVSGWLRAALERHGIVILAPIEHASPAVLTLVLPRRLSSLEVGQRMSDEGFLLSYQSRYLVERNWVQICLMSEHSPEVLQPLIDLLASVVTTQARAASVVAP